MALSTRVQLQLLRKQFETANDVHTPSAAIAIASTFGLSNACASDANQEDSENDVRMFGIVQNCTAIRASSSPCPPSSGGLGPESAAASVVTVMSADWRRTASEQAQAAMQFAEEQLVLPASASIVAVPAPDQKQPTLTPQQDSGPRNVVDGIQHEMNIFNPRSDCSRSQGGTVRETQTDATPASTASASFDPPVPHSASTSHLAAANGLGSALFGIVQGDCGHASDIYTIMDTQRGSSEAKQVPEVVDADIHVDECEAPGLDDFPSTQLQEACDISSLQATQLEPALPSCQTVPTQITERQACALEADVTTPTHSTDTQPADAPLCLDHLPRLTNTPGEEGSEVEISPGIHEEAASVDPLLQEDIAASGGAIASQQRALQQETHVVVPPDVARTVPPLPFDESGNAAYLLVQPSAAAVQPESATPGAEAQMFAKQGAVPEVNARPALQQEPGSSLSSHPSNDNNATHAATTHGAFANTFAEHDHLSVHANDGCPLAQTDADPGKSGPEDPPDAGCAKSTQCKANPAADTTQATVCDSSDGEPEARKVCEGGSHLKDLMVAMEEERGCQSASCGTVPETHTGDGNVKALPSQQTVRHPRKSEGRRRKSHVESIVLQPRDLGGSHIAVAPQASPTPCVARRGAGSASRGSAQLAAIKALAQPNQSPTPSDFLASGTPGNRTRLKSTARPSPAPAGHADATPDVDSRTDRISRKRKAQQQQSARISRVAPAVPIPSEPSTRLDSVRSTPPPQARHLSAPASPHVSPLLQLDAGLRDSQLQVTLTKRRRTPVGAAVATQRQTPSPMPTSAAPRSRTPTRADLIHCTLQPICDAKQKSSWHSMKQGVQKVSSGNRMLVKSARPSPASRPRDAHGRPSDTIQPATDSAPGRAGASSYKTAKRKSLSTGPGGAAKLQKAGLNDENERAAAARTQRAPSGIANVQEGDGGSERPEASTDAAAVVMTESQLSLQNWIDDGPLVAPAHRSMKPPEPPRFSDIPARRVAQNSPLTLSTTTPAPPEVASPCPESEEHEIKQVRSSNKVTRVLDSQTAEMFERQPDDVAPSVARNQVIAQGTGNRTALCKDQLGGAGKAHYATRPTAAVHVPVKRVAAASPAAPAASLTMATSIPCVFVSSQQGAESCVRRQKAQALAVQQAPPRHHPTEAAPEKSTTATHPSQDDGARKTPCKGAVRPRAGRSTSAPQVSNHAIAAAADSADAETVRTNRPGPQSAPAGGEWQRHTRSGNACSGKSTDDLPRQQSHVARTPSRGSPAHACELSPGGHVRRSARIAAHNIAPAVDGDKAFGAIGALSQAWSLSISDDSPPLAQPMMAAEGRSEVGGQGGGGANQSDTARCHVPAKPLAPPEQSPMRTCYRSPASRSPMRLRTPDSSGSFRDVCRRGAAEKSVQVPAGQLSSPTTALPQDSDHNRPVQNTTKPPEADHGTAAAAVHGGHNQASQRVDENDLSWGQKRDFCSAWKQTYSEFVSRKWGSVRIGDVVFAKMDHVGTLFIQVERLWFNHCTKEDCIAGTRLYPVSGTPFSVFVPGGVDKHRVLALGDDSWTLPRTCFVHPIRVVYMGLSSNCISEADAKETLRTDPDCFLCHFRLESTGGLFPL